MSRILLLGGSGLLGYDLRSVLSSHEVRAPASTEVDIRDASSVREAAAGTDVVINAAAYTEVDGAETDEARAVAINAIGAGNAAAAARDAGARLVQVSTDYVFDGEATAPYAETAPLTPRSAYGRSKAAGERAVTDAHPSPIIVRTAWLYGRGGSNFARTIAGRARQTGAVEVVADQRGQPTWSHDLAVQIMRLLEAGVDRGTFHGTSSGETTWYEFAREIFSALGEDPDRVRPITTAALSRPAPRPAYSLLHHAAWASVGLGTLPDWRDAFARAVRAGILEEP